MSADRDVILFDLHQLLVHKKIDFKLVLEFFQFQFFKELMRSESRKSTKTKTVIKCVVCYLATSFVSSRSTKGKTK